MQEYIRIAIQLSGIGIAMIGIVGLIGHISGSQTLLTWNSTVGIALPTVIAFIMTGICIYILGKYSK